MSVGTAPRAARSPSAPPSLRVTGYPIVYWAPPVERDKAIPTVLLDKFVACWVHKQRKYSLLCTGPECEHCGALPRVVGIYAPAMIEASNENRPHVRKHLCRGWNLVTFHLAPKSAELAGLRGNPVTGEVWGTLLDPVTEQPYATPERGTAFLACRDDGTITGGVDLYPHAAANPDLLPPAFDVMPFVKAPMPGGGGASEETSRILLGLRGSFREPDFTRPPAVAADDLAELRRQLEAERAERKAAEERSRAEWQAIQAQFGSLAEQFRRRMAADLADGMALPTGDQLPPLDPEAMKVARTGKGLCNYLEAISQAG